MGAGMSQRSLVALSSSSNTGEDDMAAIHKTGLSANKSLRARRALKEEATFDNELQRYVMPSERILMPKLEQSEVWKNKSQGRRLIKHE